MFREHSSCCDTPKHGPLNNPLPRAQLNHLLALLGSQPFPNPTALSFSHVTSTILYTVPSDIQPATIAPSLLLAFSTSPLPLTPLFKMSGQDTVLFAPIVVIFLILIVNLIALIGTHIYSSYSSTLFFSLSLVYFSC